jgi:hypothetical protein
MPNLSNDNANTSSSSVSKSPSPLLFDVLFLGALWDSEASDQKQKPSQAVHLSMFWCQMGIIPSLPHAPCSIFPQEERSTFALSLRHCPGSARSPTNNFPNVKEPVVLAVPKTRSLRYVSPPTQKAVRESVRQLPQTSAPSDKIITTHTEPFDYAQDQLQRGAPKSMNVGLYALKNRTS